MESTEGMKLIQITTSVIASTYRRWGLIVNVVMFVE